MKRLVNRVRAFFGRKNRRIAELEKTVAEQERQLEAAREAGPVFAWMAVDIYQKTGRVPLQR